ncbi:MAG TPA: glutamate 5-kinase [bacterium]|nr:glutamate 5-kinase [bacterium]
MGGQNLAGARRIALGPVKKIVVKVGTSLLADREHGISRERAKRLVADIAKLAGRYQFTLVTSGAVGLGMHAFKLARKPADLPTKQAIAALGQIHLMGLYYRLFHRYGLQAAQVLLTYVTIGNRSQYLHAMNALAAMHRLGIVPVVNENDTVAVDELKIGDNDRLAAYVALLDDADLLVVLTDVDGLYACAPVPGRQNEVIPVVDRIDERILAVAGCTRGTVTTGGMVTKLQAAQIATGSGVPLIIANGSCPNVLSRLLAGDNLGTLFLPRRRLKARERFIAYGSKRAGELTVDGGAAAALRRGGRSLLIAGVKGVTGSFRRGEVVSVIDLAGEEVARGVCAYSAGELRTALTKPRTRTDREVIHCDHLVLI